MNLIIDGNAFINVAISVTKSVSSKDKRVGEAYYVNDLFNDDGFILKEHARVSFRNFCFTYLNSIVSPISSFIESVHIVFDSKSWRHEYISNFFEKSSFKTSSAPSEFTYKGNRKYDDKQYLFFDYFQQTLLPVLVDKCAVNSYRVKNVEGDDLIAALCSELKGDILIYSVDQDLKQLVGTLDKNVLLIVPKQMSKHKKLFVPKSFVPAVAVDEQEDFFSLDSTHLGGSNIEKTVKALKGKDYVEYAVDPLTDILTKVLLGDGSDNIPRIGKLAPAKAQKVIDVLKSEFGANLLDSLDSLSLEFVSAAVREIAKVLKISNQEKIDELRDHLVFNIKIIRLSAKVFPKEIRDSLEAAVNIGEHSKFNFKEFNNLKNNLTAL